MTAPLLLGVTHYPGLSRSDDDMCMPFRGVLADPEVPAEEKDPANWPAPMREEWGDDGGLAAAKDHRQLLYDEFTRVRTALREYQPDAVVIIGDDQYENFREDGLPPFAVLAYDDAVVHPWEGSKWDKGNAWGEDQTHEMSIRGDRTTAKSLVNGLLERDIDMTYAYEPRYGHGFAHSIINTLMFLDHDRIGFDFPVIPLVMNCYGSRVISQQGRPANFADQMPEGEGDPISPRPSRCFEVGEALGMAAAESGKRIAIIGSASWSHAFLTDKTWHMRPDVESDRVALESIKDGTWDYFRKSALPVFEQAGHHELLSWSVLGGAVSATGARLEYLNLVESYIFNSTKCFAVFGGSNDDPAGAQE